MRLSDYRGKSAAVILFLSEVDETAGCTAEACRFRDDFEKFSHAGAVVIGISDDSTESHQRFTLNHRLPFTLLSDAGGAVRKLFGVKKKFGVIPGRVTFVIDREGALCATCFSRRRTRCGTWMRRSRGAGFCGARLMVHARRVALRGYNPRVRNGSEM